MDTLLRRREALSIYADPGAVACLCGPLLTRRKRMAVACECAARWVGFGADPRLNQLIAAARCYAGHTHSLRQLETALREADALCGEARRLSGTPVWTLSEGLYAGKASAEARSARATTGAVRWALGLPGGVAPRVPAAWSAVREVVEAAANPETCDPGWRTSDVLALARLVRDGGEVHVLPILADALQEAGCEDARILDHCRGAGPHTPACWVPDLILEMDDEL